MVNIVRNRWLCGIVESGYFKQFIGKEVNKDIFDAVWPSAWRSGIGMFLTSGLTQISSLIYAQIGSTSEVASYLLALRLIQTISQFSQAPFYSKLPALARLRSEGKLEHQIQAAKRGMKREHVTFAREYLYSWIEMLYLQAFGYLVALTLKLCAFQSDMHPMKLSYWTYVTGFVGLGLFATPLLKLIGSNAKFVSPLLSCLMGLSLFVERFGAMHLQFYSTTNGSHAL